MSFAKLYFPRFLRLCRVGQLLLSLPHEPLFTPGRTLRGLPLVGPAPLRGVSIDSRCYQRPRTKQPSTVVRQMKQIQSMWKCKAYTTAENYNLEILTEIFKQTVEFEVKHVMPVDASDVLHVGTATTAPEDSGEIFFFREGSIVFWNIADSQIKYVRRILKRYQTEAYELALVEWENEEITYKFDEFDTRLVKDTMVFYQEGEADELSLQKYAFSNALALSVKLAIWEYSLDQFIASIEKIPHRLRAGEKTAMTRHNVMKKTGELFVLRHRINLSSDLLMTPDFYWDRNELENLFNRMCAYLNISRRTSVMNEKLTHCESLIELMRSHLSERHSNRLEWMIIALITIEVVFEFIHYAARFAS